jgi:GTPase SAR1 family protein
MSADSKVLMLGLKGSGKTTFLAALWHHLESSERSGRLEIPHLQPDRDYLNAIRDNWLSLKPVGRTTLRANAAVSMELRDKESDTPIKLLIPDLSGEAYRLQWATRKAPISYANLARNCSSAFLFVHPGEVRKTHALMISDSQSSGIEVESGPPIEPRITWTHEQTSTQVQLVDLIQLLMYLREDDQHMRLAVIVSAWDLIKAHVSPSGWLESRLPLLSQFLRSNQDHIVSQIFGISAQGGDLERDRDKLLGYLFPSERSRAVVGDTIEMVEITRPLEFLLNLQNTSPMVP